jgi:hypothetical protein
MKNLTKNGLFIALAALITLSSCEKNEISSISINQTSIVMHVGESDSLVATITFTGELSEIPVSWTVDNNSIVTITEKSDAGATSKSGSNNSIQKKVIISAIQAGTAKITIGSGEKSVSCDITVAQRDFSFNQAYVSNWGDYYDIGHNNFDMYLLENTLSFNAEGELTGNGTLLYLDFNVPITQDEIAAGYFTSAENGNINTFFPGEKFQSGDQLSYGGARFVEVEGGVSKKITLIESGHFAFVAEGNSYIIGGEMTTETGEKISFTCSGTTALTDKKPIPAEINPAFTKGNLYYFGDAYETGTSNNFSVYLMTENVNLSSEELNGEILMLEFNTALSATNYIPDGTYNMINALTYENMTPLTLVFGFTTQSNENWGCWYYSDSTTKKLKTGNAVVNKSENTYTIQYELYDRFGSKIYGTYTGFLNFVQPSQVQSASAKMKRLKGGRGLDNINLNLNNKPDKFALR